MTPAQRFAGKVAFVTGGGSGLGRAAAERFAAEGASIVIADIDEAAARDVAESLPSALAVRVDTSKVEEVERSFVTALATFGRVDAIFNNAGIVGEQLPLHQMTDDSWQRVMAVNASGAFYVLRRGIAALLEGSGGAVVNTSSSSGLAGKPNLTPYTFSKAGIVGLTRSAAVEYAAQGIRVNAVAPTAVLTPMVEAHIARAPDPAAMRHLLEHQTPIPGIPLPEDVAAVVAFLASDEARWITGLTVPVDGGFHAQ